MRSCISRQRQCEDDWMRRWYQFWNSTWHYWNDLKFHETKTMNIDFWAKLHWDRDNRRKMKIFIELLHKEHRYDDWERARFDEFFLEIILKIFLQHQELVFEHVVQWIKIWFFVFLKLNLVIVETMRRKFFSDFLKKYIQKLVILLRQQCRRVKFVFEIKSFFDIFESDDIYLMIFFASKTSERSDIDRENVNMRDDNILSELESKRAFLRLEYF